MSDKPTEEDMGRDLTVDLSAIENLSGRHWQVWVMDNAVPGWTAAIVRAQAAEEGWRICGTDMAELECLRVEDQRRLQQHNEFCDLVKAMREAQRRYHTCPTVEGIQEVRRLEKEVDSLLAAG